MRSMGGLRVRVRRDVRSCVPRLRSWRDDHHGIGTAPHGTRRHGERFRFLTVLETRALKTLIMALLARHDPRINCMVENSNRPRIAACQPQLHNIRGQLGQDLVAK